MIINKTKKGVNSKVMALLVAGFLALAAVFTIFMPKAITTAKAASLIPEGSTLVTSSISSAFFVFPNGTKFVYDAGYSVYYNTNGSNVVYYVSVTFSDSFFSKNNCKDPVSPTCTPEGITYDSATGMYTFDFLFSTSPMAPQLTECMTFNVSYIHKPVPLPPDPIKEGHTFTGWFLDEELITPYNGGVVTEDMTLFAGWKINTFTVTFDSVGGSAVTTQTVNWNTAPTLTTPTKDGYTFLGWYNGSTKYEGATIKSNTALTAKWEIKTFTVIFDSVGGSAVETQTVNWNTSVTVTTPTKEGYTFLGWFIGETKYIDGAIKSNTTLTAKWEIKTYTVTFDSKGGAAVATQTVNWNTSATVSPLEREGYIFLGWFNGDVKYIDGAIKENTLLTAKWQIKTYTVTFMVDGEVYEVLEVDHGTSFEKAMEKAKLNFFNLMSDGVKDGKSGIITGDVTAEVAAMTNKETVAAFIADNTWLLWTLGTGFALFVIAAIVVIVKKARG